MSTSLPEFAYDDFVASEELGGGTFGIVSCGTYNGETVVVKKLNAIRSYTNAGKKVLKEAGIAYSLKNKQFLRCLYESPGTDVRLRMFHFFAVEF